MEINLLQTVFWGLAFNTSLAALILTIKDSLKKEKPRPKKKIPEYQSIVKEANQEASNLLDRATTQAGNILSEAHKTNEHIEEDLDSVLASIASKDIHSIEESSRQFEKSYAQQLENLNQKLQKMTFENIQNTQKGYSERLSVFTQELLKNGLSTQTMVDKKIAELVTIADQEINEYKKKRMEKIDEEVKELVEKVYSDVLKSSIPESLQHELIIKSLEEAKKDRIFNL